MTSSFSRVLLALAAGALLSFTHFASAVIRDGGVDPNNLGQGGWIYILKDATNHLAPSNVPAVTNELTLFKYLKDQGMSYVIVKAGTSNVLWTGSANTNLPPMFTKKLVDAAHANGLKIFGSNRSWGNDIPGEVKIADYVFQQGADGFIYDAESEWESSQPWIGTNGPALAWQLCSTVRSNWPNKFIAHNPYDTVFLHFSFPFKEFGYWCDAVMPQVYHHAASKNNAIAAIHWSDWNYQRLHEYYATLPPTNIDGQTIYWTNSIKPLVLMRDVYNGLSNTPSHPDSDVRDFLDYMVADPNCVNEDGYNGSDYFRSELHRPGQWANIKAATIGHFSNIVNNIVIDDARAAVVGNWTMVKTIDATISTVLFSGEVPGDTNSFGTNYWRKGQGTGAEYMQFQPRIVQPGNYNVYEWHPTRPDASAAVPFVINSSTGFATVLVNQQTNGGNWTFLGRYFFNAGTNATIRVLDSFPEPAGVASVDGLKLVYVPVVPAAPTNLKATTLGSSQVKLTWNENATNELNFIIARGTTSGGPYFDVGSAPANATTFTDSGLTDSTIYYYVVRSRAYNVDSADSNQASALTLPGAPTIVTQPASLTVLEGTSATFSVEAASSTSVSYQWKHKGAEIPGATDSSYTIESVVAASDAGDYSVVVGNEIGSTTSAAATLSVNFFLKTTVNPVGGGTISILPNQTSYVATNVVSISVTSNPGFAFVGWSGDIVSTNNPLEISMNSSKTLVANFRNTDDIIVDNPDANYLGVWTIATAAANKFGSYYQYAPTAVGGNIASATFRPNIITPGKYNVSIWYPEGTNRSSRAQVLVSYDGDTSSAEVDQTVGGGKWQVVAVGKDFAAGTNGFVTIANNTGELNKIVVADAVRFSFNPAPIIFNQPQSQMVKISSNATFQVLVGSSTPVSYQWQRNGEDIPGATSSSYTRTNVQPGDSGHYNVIISNDVEVVGSEVATLTVVTMTPPTLRAASISAENGFRFSFAGDANTTYTIETSTDLIHWFPFTDLYSVDGQFEFVASGIEGAARFYRARLPLQ